MLGFFAKQYEKKNLRKPKIAKSTQKTTKTEKLKKKQSNKKKACKNRQTKFQLEQKSKLSLKQPKLGTKL